MLRLKLVNFKQHKTLDIEFPESGFIRLHGKSGAGKTSIFDAIRFAVTGEGDDISPWESSTQTIVELTYKDIFIKRTRASATLTVQIGDKTYHDDVAEDEIIKYFNGFTDSVFLAASYIRAGMEESLLHLTPAEQLDFIESLTFSSDAEALKESINKKISDTNKELSEVTLKVNFCKEKLTSQAIPVAPIKPELDPLVTSQFEVITEQGYILKKTEAQISQLSKELTNPLYQAKALAESKISSIQEMIGVKNAELESIEGLAFAQPEKPAYTRQLRDQKLNRTNILAKMRDLAAEMAKFYGKAVKQADLEQMLAVLEADKATTIEAIKASRDPYNELVAMRAACLCPHCDQGLLVSNGKVIKYSTPPADLEQQIQEKTKQINILSDKNKEIESAISTAQRWLSQIAGLKSQLPEDPYPGVSIQDIDAKLAQWQQELTETQTKEKLNQQQIVKLKNEIKDLSVRLQEQQKILTVELRPQESIKEELLVLNLKQSELEKFLNLESNQAVAKQVANFLSDSKGYEINYAHYRKQAEEYNTRVTEVNELTVKQKSLEGLLAAAKRLKERSDSAAMESIDGVLSTINSYAKPRLDRMFPSDGTSIVLKNQSVTQKGEIRPKIGIEVIHKSKTVKKLKSLSLGEKSRAYLAFQLAVTDLYSSPFLMVDEGFPGLPDEQLLECLQILQEESKDKLILVIEHGAPEHIFDQVVTVDE
jgi:DNA repair exonuclease SbcCD ATPase subunit